ncbi:MAG: hypothetical protein QXG32_00680 [Candidatus Bathyarchaeia archaeon]
MGVLFGLFVCFKSFWDLLWLDPFDPLFELRVWLAAAWSLCGLCLTILFFFCRIIEECNAEKRNDSEFESLSLFHLSLSDDLSAR